MTLCTRTLVLWLVPGLAFTKYRCEFVNLFCIYADTAFVIVILLWCCDYSLLQKKTQTCLLISMYTVYKFLVVIIITTCWLASYHFCNTANINLPDQPSSQSIS